MLTKFAVVTLLIAFSQIIDGKGTATGKTSKPNKFCKRSLWWKHSHYNAAPLLLKMQFNLKWNSTVLVKCPTGKSAVGSLLSGIASSLRSKKDLPDICYNVVVNEFTARIGKQVRIELPVDTNKFRNFMAHRQLSRPEVFKTTVMCSRKGLWITWLCQQ